jgi:hydroxymethylbilane synthase
MIAFSAGESALVMTRERIVARAKQIAVGCRGDALAALYLEELCDALREAHPHVAFVAADEGGKRSAPARQRGRVAGAKAALADSASDGETSRRLEPRRAAAMIIQRVVKGEIDVGVLDARSVPLQIAPPIEVAAVLERTNPFDVLISHDDLILDEQPESACIAAVDAVKRGQLLYYRPDLKLVEGEDDFDRLFSSLHRRDIDAFVYPAADVEALHQQRHVAEVFTASICTPPSGQGAQVLLVRRDRRDVCALLRALNDPSTAAEIELERLLLEHLTRDGRGPVGVLGNVEANVFEIEAAIASPDGAEKISGTIGGPLADRLKIVPKLAAELLAAGGDEIIASYRRARGAG